MSKEENFTEKKFIFLIFFTFLMKLLYNFDYERFKKNYQTFVVYFIARFGRLLFEFLRFNSKNPASY